METAPCYFPSRFCILNRSMKKWVWLLLLLLAAALFWLPLLVPGHAPFLRDLSSEIIPKRAFWAEAGGAVLWDPLGFFGHPFAANPQSEAFYPFNFLFLLMPAFSALGWYVFLHWILFLFFSFLAFCEFGFEKESAFAMSLALGFGGFFCSLSVLIVLLSTVSWTAVELFLLARAMKDRAWFYSLLAGLAFAVQILAGEVQMAALGWLLIAMTLLIHRPAGVGIKRIAFALAAALVSGIILSSFQWLLTREMLPLSNREGGYGWREAEYWSLLPARLREFLVPSYFLSTRGAHLWGLGLFNYYPYLLSIYPGLGVLMISLRSLRPNEFRAWLWFLASLFGTIIALGQYTPVYGWLLGHLPGFDLFRFPEKFIMLPAFGLVMMTGLGMDDLFRSKTARPLMGWSLIALGLALGLLLIVFPLNLSSLGNRLGDIQKYLRYRSLFRSLAAAAVLIGWFLLKPWAAHPRMKMLAGLVIFVDLFLAHHNLNPGIVSQAFKAPAALERLEPLSSPSSPPLRVFTEPAIRRDERIQGVLNPVEVFERMRDGLMPFWPMYFGLDDTRAHSSLYLMDQDRWLMLLDDPAKKFLTLARSGTGYYFEVGRGFSRIPHSAPRAAIYYRAVSGLSRDQILQIWPDPNFPADRLLLLEGEAGGAPEDSLLPCARAKITEYKNEKVAIEAEAKTDGWLILLDSYYPGWKAYVDGNEEPILRADGFFRAVQIPAGRHRVVFQYRPEPFYLGLMLSGAGFAVWLGLLWFSRGKKIRR